jgi:hypothetical protein
MLLTCWLMKANLFSDGEFISKCLQHIMQEICWGKATVSDTVSSSRATSLGVKRLGREADHS